MNDIYQKLVDMYAGRELPAELEEILEREAIERGRKCRERPNVDQ